MNATLKFTFVCFSLIETGINGQYVYLLVP